jgi:hypothetical protein
MPVDEPLQMSIDLVDGSTLRVVWSPADETWFWQIFSAQGQLIQGGMNLQIAHGHTGKDAMKVLLQFLVLAVDHPLPEFCDATHVWAATRRDHLRKALSG